jgi:hypothetical protein
MAGPTLLYDVQQFTRPAAVQYVAPENLPTTMLIYSMNKWLSATEL